MLASLFFRQFSC